MKCSHLGCDENVYLEKQDYCTYQVIETRNVEGDTEIVVGELIKFNKEFTFSCQKGHIQDTEGMVFVVERGGWFL